MDSLTRARQEVDTLLISLRADLDAHAAQHAADLSASLAARSADLDRREEALARAMELATTDAAVAAAWQQSRIETIAWFQRLISLQLEHLAPTSGSRTVLRTLSRMVEQGEP